MRRIAGIAKLVWWVDYELDDRSSTPDRGREGNFSYCHRVQTALLPASNPVGNEGSWQLPWG
jgi:hypothetical protein